MAELLQAGGPAGRVLNVVNGDKGGGGRAADRPAGRCRVVCRLHPIAQYIYATASAHGKRVQALGGAKNHMVVMPDANLDQAVSALMGAAYGAAGERCMAISVAVVVGDETADALVAKLSPLVAALRVGPARSESGERDGAPHQPGTPGQGARLRGSGGGRGAELVVDGRGPEPWRGLLHRGQPVLIGSAPRCASTGRRFFGPVLAIVRAPDYETALRLINEHEYGNGTAIFTGDGDTAGLHHAGSGRYGRVNVPIPVPMAFHSFGGWKRSIFGPLNMHGPDGVRFYTG